MAALARATNSPSSSYCVAIASMSCSEPSSSSVTSNCEAIVVTVRDVRRFISVMSEGE